MLGAPTDYWGQLSNIDLGKTLTDSFQGAQQQQVLQAQQQRAAQQQAQLDQARAEAIRNPSAANYNRLFILDPKSQESIKAAHDAMDGDQQKAELRDLSSIRGYIAGGRADQAATLIQRRIGADKAAGQDTADDEQMLEIINSDPDAAKSLVDYKLAGIMNPDKWEATFKATQDAANAAAKLPSEIAKTGAEAGLATAQAGKAQAETVEVAPNAESDRALQAAQTANYQSAIDDRVNQYSLERDKLETNTQIELQKLAGKGVPLSQVSEQTMNAAVVSSEASRQLGNRASTLADKLDASPQITGGVFASLNEFGKGAFGNQDAVSALRKEYTQLANSQAVMNLPPGPASDKDIKLAMAGFPPPSANAPTMASFLRGMAKLQTIKANRDQAKADWISENGNLGRAKNDITVNGVKVPAGTNFGEFSASASSTERRAAPPERSYMKFAR